MIFSRNIITIALFLISWDGLVAQEKSSRRFDLPCLAPLLERVDSSAPLNLDEAFLFGPWHAPVERAGIGQVDFEITTESVVSQRWFNQGVALLHSFWYGEAERCFRQALLSDAECPMLYWGLAMANERRPQRAAVFAAEAKRYSVARAELSDLERDWIDILSNFYAGERATFKEREPKLDAQARADRRRERIQQLESLVFSHPDAVEPEACLLRQVILDESMHGDPIASYHALDLLAMKLTEAAPTHPSKLYRSLLWMRRDPQRALPLARESIVNSLGVPDAWRVAGEVFRANGEMRVAVEFFREAVARGLKEAKTMPDLTENLVSNYATLVDAYISMGQFDDARAAALELMRMPRSFYLEKRHTHAQRLAGSYATGRRLFGEVHLRLEKWEELLDVSAVEGDWFSQVDSQFWRGIALVNLGRFDEARAGLKALKKNTNISAEERAWMAGLAQSLQMHIELSTGDRKTVPGSLNLTGLPTDHIARLYFAAGFKEDALELIDTELAMRPGQFLATATYVDLHFRNGDSKQALFRFDSEFREAASLATADLPVMERLKPVAKAMHLHGRWTKSLPPIVKLGERAAPRWSSQVAPDWELPDHSGKLTRLSSFRGKPVVVNFFLGVACPFCRVQLDKFAPQLDAYREAGVEFIGVTRDSLETLQLVTGDGVQKTEDGNRLLPFPVFADPEMKSFKALGAFDQFDDFPMHATFLIDARGRVLWSDIGHAPFSHPAALLREAGRLRSLVQEEK